MKQVGIAEAATVLSRLVEEVEGGGEVVITRDGKPVAKLVRAGPRETHFTPEVRERRAKALAELREIGDRIRANLTHEQIKALIAKGRH